MATSLEKYKTYTIKELKNLLGDDWFKQIASPIIPKCLIPKQRIYNFNEFNEETKQIYIQIYDLIKQKNPNQNFNVWATGSRVKGKWRTKEETDEISTKYNIKPKYSDYDYCTDAINKPTKQEFLTKIGIPVDFAGGEGHKVLIDF